MLTRTLLAVSVVLITSATEGQTTVLSPAGATAATPAVPVWRAAEKPGSTPAVSAGTAATTGSASPAATAPAVLTANSSSSAGSAAAAASTPRAPIARVTAGPATLPSEQGQVWREYDITPYTARVTTTKRPEQAIVDWILRETGYEAWHSEPLGILCATPRSLRVYHTPQMQAVVGELVDRFVSSEAQTNFSIRVVTIDNPNWRARGQNVLRPVQVQTPGVAAWLLQKEETASLLAELQRRTDYREHSSPQLLVNNGQSSVVSVMRARPYTRDVIPRPDVWPGYEVKQGQIDEGFSMDFSPLLTLDRRLIDATIKCEITQVEKMLPVVMEVPTPNAPRQRAKIEVPQISHFRFHERFRWPIDQVLVVSMGVVALPVPIDAKSVVPGLPLPLPTSPARADLLVFVDCKGQQAPAAAAAPRPAGPTAEAKTYRGRY
jgi:hypothetical protein